MEAAKATLLKKFAAFVQVRARVAVRDDTSDDAKERALKSIEQLDKRLHNTASIALAYRAAADPVGKIHHTIEDMIARILQEASDEAAQEMGTTDDFNKNTKDPLKLLEQEQCYVLNNHI